MNKIELKLLSLFASADETRWILTLPRVIGDFLVATDGRVLVEVPLSEVDPAGLEDLEVREGNFPNYLNVIDPEFEGEMVPFEIPPMGDRKVEWVECFDCRGQGHYEGSQRMICEECDGVGKWEDGSEWIVTCEGFSLAGLYVEKVMQLPEVRWFLPGEVTETMCGPVRFRFGKSGRGVLMPLRMGAATAGDAPKRKSPCEVLGAVIRREADGIARGSSALAANDVAELIRALARLIEGKSVTKAMGAPGDWGYGTDIGDALMKVYREGVEG